VFHSSPPTLAGTMSQVTHSCRRDTIHWIQDVMFVQADFTSIGGKPGRLVARSDGHEWFPMVAANTVASLGFRTSSDTELLFKVDNLLDLGFPQRGLVLYHVPPKLSVERHDNVLRISWPGPAFRYWLETSTAASGQPWTLGPKPQDGPNSTRVVELAAPTSPTFFRLRRIPELPRN
jgi:hypothetical protein